MPGKDILVVVDNEASVAHRLAPIAALAKRGAVRLTGMYVTGMPPAQAFADINGWAQLVDAYLTMQRAEALKTEQAFRQEIARLGLSGDWLCREADMTEGVIDLARLHDLVVMGQTNPDAPSNGLRPGEVVLAAGRPALLVPYAGEFATLGQRVIVCWNGTREASRALYDAMFLVEAAEAVTVLEIDPPDAEVASADLRARHVVDALRRRGVTAKAETTVSDGTPVADLILSLAADLSADLIVMGGWGHSRLREYILGGASRGILDAMTVPVLMSH
ncbi:MAG TPA: universal stress protein [Stellaceae bacterium]|nr:universal stress protein [Stellaceae bacterium]